MGSLLMEVDGSLKRNLYTGCPEVMPLADRCDVVDPSSIINCGILVHSTYYNRFFKLLKV
ncbi:hypothetical protein THIOKS12170012 [Thiocapsa sp. KS1]|nr:hypothetical protein THIOKS12170012 [Thiocapsa sp. KS1]